MSLIRCTICDKAFDPEKSTALPFCGERCRRIDLGRWLDERYSLPVERSEDEEFEEQQRLPPDET
ncbi:MAG TPA: DNA gyrase inhibitor YacG [Pirellulales bacterium]|jgi:hypothetical protein